MIRSLTALGASAMALCFCACSDTENDPGSAQAALETYRDGCGESDCGQAPPPAHRCTGGYEYSVCTKARGACAWQVDCADEPTPGYDGSIGVSPCDTGQPEVPSRCGPLPTYDEKECVWGFVGTPQCESYDRAACDWSHRCRPEPCERTGTCNTLDRNKVGARCDGSTQCPEGSSCSSIAVNIGDYVEASCIQGDPCEALTCADDLHCFVMESYPSQVACGR